MIPRSKSAFARALVIGAALLGVLGTGGCVVLLVLQNTLWSANPFSLNVLHSSTFSHVKNSADETAMLFADRTHALVADNIWKNRQLYLVDLVTATRKELNLPAGRLRNLQHLIYGGDVIYALYTEPEQAKTVAYRVSPDGAIVELTVLEYISRVIGQEPPEAARVQEALESGALGGLRTLEKQLCAWDATSGRYIDQGTRRVQYFANERHLVVSNVDAMNTTLRQASAALISDSCALRMMHGHQRYRLELTRTEATESGLDSALDARISAANLYRDGQLVHTYTFKEPRNPYYSATWVDNRLYFVGADVSYLNLDSLP
jgi:hypothetical protein